MSKTVFMDTGHGGADVGAVNGSRFEKTDNLNMAHLVENLLTKRGITTIMSRTNDTAVSLAARTNKANASKADLFISIHRNSFTNATANGVEVWVYTTAGATEIGAATEVLEQLVAVGVQSNRGIKKGNYHVLRESKMPAMLIELGFISNKSDNEMFDRHFKEYAEAVAKGICVSLGVVWENDTPQTPIYRVQVGAFGIKSNAEAFLGTVREMGLQAFLVAEETAKKE